MADPRPSPGGPGAAANRPAAAGYGPRTPSAPGPSAEPGPGSSQELRRRLLGSLAVLTAAAAFGTLGPITRLVGEAGFPAIVVVTWRSLVGAIVVTAAIALLPAARSRLVGPSRIPARARLGLLAATLSSVALNLAVFQAFERVAIALALLGFYTYPAMVALVDRVRTARPLGPVRLVALGFALVGMALVVVGPGVTVETLDLLGIGLALGAAAAQTVYVSIGRDGYPSVPTEQAIAMILLAGTPLFAIAAFVAGQGGAVLRVVELPDVWPYLALAGLVGGGGASLLYLFAIRAIGPLRTGILALFEPVVGTVLAAVVLGESLLPIQLAGGALVLAGASLVQLAPDGTPAPLGTGDGRVGALAPAGSDDPPSDATLDDRPGDAGRA